MRGGRLSDPKSCIGGWLHETTCPGTARNVFLNWCSAGAIVRPKLSARTVSRLPEPPRRARSRSAVKPQPSARVASRSPALRGTASSRNASARVDRGRWRMPGAVGIAGRFSFSDCRRHCSAVNNCPTGLRRTPQRLRVSAPSVVSCPRLPLLVLGAFSLACSGGHVGV